MAEPSLTLIVVTHNSARWLPGFFKTWSQAVPTIPTEIVIADSGSTDETHALAAALAPTARVLECGNIGYGAAANRAAASSSSPWILLCNPDLEFPENFETSFLRPTMDNPSKSTGCIAPGLINQNGTGQFSVGNFPTIFSLLRDQTRPPRQRKYVLTRMSKDRMFDWATGAILLIRRDHWSAVSGFDEKFFLYVEEVDFQRRLANIGLRTCFMKETAVSHLSPAAHRPIPQIKRYSARGLLRYFAKHGSTAQLFACRLLVTLRLPASEAFAPRKKILETPTGP